MRISEECVKATMRLGLWIGTVSTAVGLLFAARPALAEPFIEGYGGKAWHLAGSYEYETTFRETRDSEGALGWADSGVVASASAGGAEWDDFSFEPPIYYGYRGGYFFSTFPKLGVAFDLIHSKARLNRFAAPGGQAVPEAPGMAAEGAAPDETSAVRPPVLTKFEISHGLNLLMVVAFLRTDPKPVPMSSSMSWRFYSGAGFGPAVPHPEVELAGVLHQGYEFDGNDWSGELIGGLRLQLWKGLSLFTEYKFSGIRLDVHIPGGSAVTDIYSHHWALGSGWSF